MIGIIDILVKELCKFPKEVGGLSLSTSTASQLGLAQISMDR